MTDKPIINESDDETVVSRRAVLAKLGLAGLAIYSAPALLNLSDAEAGSRKSKKTKKSKKSKKTHRGKGGSKKTKKTKKSKKSKKSKKTHRGKK